MIIRRFLNIPGASLVKMHFFILNAFCAMLFVLCSTGARADTNNFTYYVNDALGSPVVGMNQAGDVVWRKAYQPYGKAGGKDGDNRVGYTGHVEDKSDLVYAGARYYDPTLGRFLSDDPMRFTEKNPMSFNRYSYANNNPYKFVDPDGREVFSVNAALAGARVMVFANTGDANSVPSVGVASDMPENFNSADLNVYATLKNLFKEGKFKLGAEFSHADTKKSFFLNEPEESTNVGVGEFSDKGKRSTIAIGPGVPGKDKTNRYIVNGEILLGSKKGNIVPETNLGKTGEALSPHL